MPIFGITAAVVSAIVGIGSFLTGGTLLAKIAMTGLSMAAQYAMQKFFGPKPPAAQASQLETRYGEKLARDIVQNLVGTAGHHIYRNAYGPGNRTVQDVFVLSHWNIAGVTRVRFKGEWKTLGGEVNAERGQRIQGIDAEIWVKVYTGRMDQVADAGLIARSNPPGRWTESHRGAGVAYAVVTNVLTRAHLPSPWEAFFEVEGVTYDWRKDSTVGGDGPHRYNDPTTWEPTTNPVLMAYCATRGFYRGTEKIVGKGRSASALPLAQWTLAANICDEIVAGKKRYQASCILSSGEGSTHDANLRPLMEACAGSWLEMVGQEYPIVGANQTPVTSFADDDVIIDEAFRFSQYRTRSELVNTVAGTFVDPESFYQAMPLATRTDDVALAQDRERLAVPLTYSVVTEAACADRLADIALRASRYQASADLCLLPKYLALKPGQWVTWTSARHGWTKVFQVQAKRLGAFGPKSARSVFVSLQEVGDGIFDPTAYSTTPPGGIPQGGPTYQSELQDLVIVGITVKDEDSGKQYPAIRAAWTAIEDPTVIGVDFRYRLKAQPDILLAHPTVPDDVSLTTIANGVVSSTIFELSYRLLTSPFRQTPWTAWVEVLTRDTPPTDIYLPGVVDGIIEIVDDNYRFMGPGLRELIDDARRLAASLTSQDFANYRDKQQLRIELKSSYEQVTAEYQAVVSAATGPGSAIVQRLETLEVEMPGKASASAVLLLSSRVDTVEGGLHSFSEAVTSLNAAYGDISASANLRMSASAGPSGYAARIAFGARAGGAGAYRSSSWFIDVPSSTGDPTRIVLVGDQVVLTNGAQNRRPFVFQGNTLYLDAVVVEWAKITNVAITTAQIASARIEWAQIDNVNITSAMIGNATILTGNIAANAVTSEDNDGRTQATTADGLWYDLATVVIESPSGNPVKAQISVSSNITPGPGGSGGAQFEVWRTKTGEAAVNITNSVAFNQLWMDAVPSTGTYTYLVRGRRNGGVSGSVTANIIAECNKV